MCAGLGSPSTWLLDSWETHVSSAYDHNSQRLMNKCDLAHHPSSRTTLMAVVLIRCGGARATGANPAAFEGSDVGPVGIREGDSGTIARRLRESLRSGVGCGGFTLIEAGPLPTLPDYFRAPS